VTESVLAQIQIDAKTNETAHALQLLDMIKSTIIKGAAATALKGNVARQLYHAAAKFFDSILVIHIGTGKVDALAKNAAHSAEKGWKDSHWGFLLRSPDLHLSGNGAWAGLKGIGMESAATMGQTMRYRTHAGISYAALKRWKSSNLRQGAIGAL
jgi:hypothetical protein